MADDPLSIETTAAQPKRVTNDGVTVEEHSPKDLVEADRHLQSNDAAKAKNFGVRFGQMRNQGTA